MSGLNPAEVDDPEYSRLYRVECTMISVRWAAVLFSLVQIFTFYQPYPSGFLALAVGVAAIFAAGNVVIRGFLRRGLRPAELKRLSVASLVFDLFIAEAFVFVYTFDVETAIWALIYLLPLAGAIRFQLRGALGVTAAATVLYTLREIYGTIKYDNEFLITSITFRMGIAFLIAFVAGSTTNDLLRRQREIAKANVELSEMNQSMRDFVSIASHDMRTPLSIIGGLARHIVQHGDTLTEKELENLVGVIGRNTESLERLVNDLLTTSSIEAGTIARQPALIELPAAVDEAKSLAKSDVQTYINVPTELTIWADSDHVRRILVNLLQNASKYGKAPVQVDANSHGDDVTLRVSDSGDGVPTELVPRLFERFARGSNFGDREQGCGLGLAIVKGLAEANGGSAWYEQNKPKGAVFCVKLPATMSQQNDGDA